MVDVRNVHSSEGMGFYLAKYLSKMTDSYEQMKDLGFYRRWTRARNWPSPEPIQLRGSADEQWEGTEVVPRWYKRKEMDEIQDRYKNSALLDRVGDSLGLALGKRSAIRRGFKVIEQIERGFKS